MFFPKKKIGSFMLQIPWSLIALIVFFSYYWYFVKRGSGSGDDFSDSNVASVCEEEEQEEEEDDEMEDVADLSILDNYQLCLKYQLVTYNYTHLLFTQ